MKVVSVVSGGLDSMSYMSYWLFEKKAEVYPLVFDYGQKAKREIESAKEVCRELGLEPKVIDISFMNKLWRGTQLTDESMEVKRSYEPTVVVPVRNAVFLTIATAYAFSIGAEVVTYGAHLSDCQPRSETDTTPMYPDCTPEFAKMIEYALNIGHLWKIRGIIIKSPAIDGLTKAENLKIGHKYLGDKIYRLWSCYLSGEKHCGRCESCMNRKRAFIEAGIPDKTEYEMEGLDED